MVNKPAARSRARPVGTLIGVYVAVVVLTLVALVALAAEGSPAATSDAWVHAVIVAGFAVLLPLRWRAVGRGAPGALRAVGVIAAVLAVVNLVEAFLPGLFPAWMRIEMVGIAVLMAVVAFLAVRHRR